MDFNISPYYSDDSVADAKKFLRILFNPGRAVQARELTQIQSVLQSQITKFADHIFKNGSMVMGGDTLIHNRAEYLKVYAFTDDSEGATTQLEDFNNLNITGATSGAIGKVLTYRNPTIDDSHYLLFIQLINPGPNGGGFQSSEHIYAISSNGVQYNATLAANTNGDLLTGPAAIAAIKPGIFYVNGSFVRTDGQVLVLEPYTNLATYRIGLEVVESIVTSVADSTLTDPARGTPNYNAPGADRYKIDLVLTKKPLSGGTTVENNSSINFIELMRIEAGVLKKHITYPTYSEIEKTLARRTYDESGDYTVRSFGLHAEISSNDDLVKWAIGKGKAYVRGHEFETIDTDYVHIDRARDYSSKEGYDLMVQYGNYAVVNDMRGFTDTGTGMLLHLHNTNGVGVDVTSTGTYYLTKIGQARARKLSYVSGTLATTNCEYNLYIYDVSMDTGHAFVDVKSFYNISTNGSHTITVNTQSTVSANGKDINGNTVLSETNYGALIAEYPEWAIRGKMSQTGASGITNVSYIGYQSFNPQVVGSAGSHAFALSLGGAKTFYGSGVLSASTIRENFHIVDTTTGQVMDWTTSGATINVTSPTSAVFTWPNATYDGDYVAVTCTVNVDENDSTSPPPNRTKVRQKCFQLDIPTGYDATGWFTLGKADVLNVLAVYASDDVNTRAKAPEMVVQNVVGSGFVTGETVSNNNYSDEITGVVVSYDSISKQLVLATRRTWTNTMSVTGRTSGTVAEVVSFTANQMTNEVSSKFVLDNGQRDGFYDYGYLSLKSGQHETRRLLVIFDYFSHTGDGYLSVDSYDSADITYAEVPVYTSAADGRQYYLRDCIDFRPRRQDATMTSIATGVYRLTATSDTIENNLPPLPNTNFESDYEYYLNRIDKLVLTKDLQFQVIKGIPGLNPQIPADSPDAMTLYVMRYPAYTFDPTDIKIQYIENKRYTMRDIGKLEKRIENLEYYTTLNLLEKETETQVIRDASGNERFKNGFLVDNFSGHNIGDVTNFDYNCSIDFENNICRPPFTSYYRGFDAGTLTNAKVTGDLLTLNYTETTLVNQPLTSSSITLNPYNIVSWVGKIKMTPDIDQWIDTENRPAINYNIVGENDAWNDMGRAPGDDRTKGWGTQWNDWESVVTGRKDVGQSKDLATQDTANTWTPNGRSNLDATNNSWSGWETTTAKALDGSRDISSKKATKVNNNNSQTVATTRKIGNRIVNVAITPYIRSQDITVKATGLKPNTTVYAFFDNVDVGSYFIPAATIRLVGVSGNYVEGEKVYRGSVAGSYVGTVLHWVKDDSVSTNTGTLQLICKGYPTGGSIILAGEYGGIGTIDQANSEIPASIVTNDHGTVGGIFELPNNSTLKFRCGDRTFRFVDSATNDLTNYETLAEKVFHAQGMETNMEEGTVSTRSAIIKRVPLSTNDNDTVKSENGEASSTDPWSKTITASPFYNKCDPLAQSYSITSDVAPNGCFITSVNLYFRTKSTKNIPVTLQLRPLSNGYPDNRKVIPFGEVTLMPDDVGVSEDATIATTFTFESPVYHAPGEYAIVILSNSSEYELFKADVGATQLNSLEVISKQPYAGTLFTSQTSSTWDTAQESDLMFKINKATFNPTGEARLLSKVGTDTNDSFIYNAIHIASQDFNLNPIKIEWAAKTKNTSGVEVPSGINWNSIDVNKSIAFDTERKLGPHYSQGDVTLKATMYTGDVNVSPVLDLAQFGGIYIKNNVDRYPLVSTEITSSGEGYQTAPIVDVRGAGIKTISITSGGNYFIAPPTVTITGGYGSNAQAVATITNGTVTGITVTNPGYGYEQDGTSSGTIYVTLTGGGGAGARIRPQEVELYPAGTGATVSARVTSNGVVSIQVLNQGSGYTTTPIVTIGAPDLVGGRQATAAASIGGGVITGITVLDRGAGYTATPQVTIGSPDLVTGIQATAAAIRGGGVTELTITDPGENYISKPRLVFTGGGPGGGAPARHCRALVTGSYGEENATGGNNTARYITRRITLNDGFDASYVKVFFEANVPSATEIKVYAKVMPNEDGLVFDDQTYTELTRITDGKTLVSLNNEEYIECEYENLTSLGKFKYLTVKIVFMSTDTCQAPSIKNLRVIALDN